MSQNLGERVTPTNAGPDSKGMMSVFGWELEGTTAFYLVAGAVGFMVLMFVLQGVPFVTRIGVALLPVIGTVAWVKFMVHGRPPGYQFDKIDGWIFGGDFCQRPQKWTKWRHPRVAILAEVKAKEACRG